jgi:hypothetical protein
VSWQDWKTDAWFTLEFITDPDLRCRICQEKFAPGDRAYTVLDYESQDYAHVRCADEIVKCSCCGGYGWHQQARERHPVLGIASGWGPPSRSCKSCEGRGFNPSGPLCGSPGLPP